MARRSSTWVFIYGLAKDAIADQAVEVRKRLQSITSSSIQSVNQGPCCPALIFFDLEPHGPFHSDDQLCATLNLALHGGPQPACENLKDGMPICEP